MIKIGFIGTQGTGKTTMCYDLAACLKKMGHNAKVMNEVARNCPLPINEEADIRSQLWIIGTTLAEEVGSKCNLLICDRTLLDSLVYTSRIDKTTAKLLEPFVEEYMKSYDIIFYMRPNKGYLLEDGERSTNIEFQKDIQKLMERYIDKLDIPIIESDKPLYEVLKLLGDT